uniref:Phosphodiesterase n=1 Tax=Amphora coffeiformis TaxID=265554 RepID=A0A7S3P5D0_9STRA
MATNQQWPFVTVSDFERRALEVSGLAASDLIIFAPLVAPEQLDAWNMYSAAHRNWTITDFDVADSTGIYAFEESGLDISAGQHFAPAWQYGPGVVDTSLINANLFSHPVFQPALENVLNFETKEFSQIEDLSAVLGFTTNTIDDKVEPRSLIVQQVHKNFEENSPIVGFLIAVESWTKIFADTLPEGVDGYLVHVKGSCGSENSYWIDGPRATFAGRGNMNNGDHNDLAVSRDITAFTTRASSSSECKYTMTVYPSETVEDEYYTNKPYVYAAVVLAMFLVTCSVFFSYDRFVQVRQTKLVATANRTKKIVQSLFPENVGKKLIQQAEQEEGAKTEKRHNAAFPPKNKAGGLKGYLDGDADRPMDSAEPIADFFSDTTILFCDIVGFTAWSSTREPKQVFALLESVFSEFDSIAKKRKVFKVETVGDCYVAVVGLPEPRVDHAVVMARFARDCLFRFRVVSKNLEVELGPSTADLGVRIGIHSGPVTAGVLRGEKARFQLFGDTMNTASRIETTGKANRVHISQETGELLQKHGKGHWLQARHEKVEAKGKGTLTTYWLDLKSAVDGGSKESSSNGGGDDAVDAIDHDQDQKVVLDEKASRLVKWNVDILSRYLRKIVARRMASSSPGDYPQKLTTEELMDRRQEGTILDHTQDIISMPHFSEQVEKRRVDPESIKLDDNIMEQLNKYVQTMAAMYRENPFHNFEHATHVTMSVVKLINRIVAPDLGDKHTAKSVHDHTYGITSDPLTSFSVILAALLHDVDHQGVTNAQLVKEKAVVAAVYQNKSVAEQNSFSLGWSLLMEDEYTDLRRTIYSTTAEFRRFKQLLVNSILATDIMDKDLGSRRKERWVQAFSEQASDKTDSAVTNENRKATIVIEHLIQASDVAHTMQHWQIYRKWNAKLFKEMYKAFRAGRMAVDPSTFWYQGEIGFLDNYVIPLARKLKDCGVFGVSSDEYLNYAKQNRKLWTDKGEHLVEELISQAAAEMEEARVALS